MTFDVRNIEFRLERSAVHFDFLDERSNHQIVWMEVCGGDLFRSEENRI